MKIVIADGHQLVREGTACLLRSMAPGIIIEGASTGAEALGLYAAHAPGVLITDMLLPDYSGLELCKRVRRRWRKARVVFLSSIDDTGMIKQALEVGAQGFVSKSCRPAELVAAIRKTAAGEAYIEHRLATKLAMGRAGAMGSRLSEMTQRELEVLILFARGEPNRNVAQRLSISEKTVANHLSILKSKLEVSSALELLHFAVDSGLVHYGGSGSGYTALAN
ncbi:MAG: response regulator transcription factor [Marinobacter sp.]|nr:response regulator transcription factor [Marinobacter sp.]